MTFGPKKGILAAWLLVSMALAAYPGQDAAGVFAIGDLRVREK